MCLLAQTVCFRSAYFDWRYISLANPRRCASSSACADGLLVNEPGKANASFRGACFRSASRKSSIFLMYVLRTIKHKKEYIAHASMASSFFVFGTAHCLRSLYHTLFH